MNKAIGLAHVGQKPDSLSAAPQFGAIRRDCSEQTAREIDEEIKKRLAEDHETAMEILRAHRDELDDRWAQAAKTAYVTPGIRLRLEYARADGRRGKSRDPLVVGALPPREQPLVLNGGDTLILTRKLVPSRPAAYDSTGRLLAPATIGCTLPEVFAGVCSHERVWLDDGKLGGEITAGPRPPSRPRQRDDRPSRGCPRGSRASASSSTTSTAGAARSVISLRMDSLVMVTRPRPPRPDAPGPPASAGCRTACSARHRPPRRGAPRPPAPARPDIR